MKTLFSILALACPFVLSAQQNSPEVVASSGDYFTGINFTNSFTVGEMTMVETFSPGTYILTQGFQQADYGPTAVVNGAAPVAFGYYPNPTNGLLNMVCTLKAETQISFDVIDLTGRLMLRESKIMGAGAQHHTLDLSAFASGTYLVRCTLVSGKEQSVLTTRISLVN